MRRLLLYTLMIVVLGSTSTFSQAKYPEDLPLIAAVTNYNLFFYSANGAQQITDYHTDNLFLNHLVWSPDGQKLFFTYLVLGKNYQIKLMMTDSKGNEPLTLSDHFVSTFPITFSIDGTEIIYASFNRECPHKVDMSFGGYEQQPSYCIMSRKFTTEAKPKAIGAIRMGGECGGVIRTPTVEAEKFEIDFPAFYGYHFTFTNTPYGLLHSTNCSGYNIASLDLKTGKDTPLGASKGYFHNINVQVSPDKQQILGIGKPSDLIVSDLRTRTSTAIETNQSQITRVNWGTDDKVFFSTIEVIPQTALLTPTQIKAYYEYFDRYIMPPAQIAGTLIPHGMADPQLPQYRVKIYQFDLKQRSAQLLYSEQASAVGRLFMVGEYLYFSIIPDQKIWINKLASGQISVSAPDTNRLVVHSVAAHLFRIHLPSGALQDIGPDINQSTPNSMFLR